MTRIYEIESEEFSRIEEGVQSFIILKNDKVGIKAGDTLILQDMPEEEGAGIRELAVKVDFLLEEGFKKDFVACQLKAANS